MDERKALRIADLLDCTAERRVELRARTVKTMQYLEQTRYKQMQRAAYDSDAIVPTAEQHRRNLAPHVLMLECLDEIDLGDRAPVSEEAPMETWIKWQCAGCPMVEVHGKSVENARAEYAAVLELSELHFAQWGAKTPEGNIVLGEYVNG